MSNLIECLALVMLGGLLWTLLEYFVHGILSHRFSTPVSPLHWGHHLYLERVFTPALAWIPVTILISSLLIFSIGLLDGISLAIGLFVGFVYYEYCHWRIHFRKPLSRRQRLLRDHHLAHHFRNPKAYFGVTTTFWDSVFGSLPNTYLDDYRQAGQCHPLDHKKKDHKQKRPQEKKAAQKS